MINARMHVLDMIRSAAEKAAKDGVSVTVEYREFGFDGEIKATVTATPKPSGASQGEESDK